MWDMSIFVMIALLSMHIVMKYYISAPIKYVSRIYLVIRVVIQAYTNAESVFSDVFRHHQCSVTC